MTTNDAEGPEEYCKRLYGSLENTAAGEPSHNVVFNQLSNDQQQPGAVGDDLYNDPSNSGLNIPLTNILADGQSYTVDTTMTEYQTDHSGALGALPEQNFFFYPSSGSTSTGGPNSLSSDQLDYFGQESYFKHQEPYFPSNTSLGSTFAEGQNLYTSDQLSNAIQRSEPFTSNPDIQVLPTLFIPSPNQDEFIYPHYKPSDYDYTSAINPEQYLFNPSSESTSIGGQNPIPLNQLDIQEQEHITDNLEVPFTPSMFFSSPDEHDIIDPLYKPLH